MASLADYLKHVKEQQKPQPQPVDEETKQKAEAYDHLTGRSDADD